RSPSMHPARRANRWTGVFAVAPEPPDLFSGGEHTTGLVRSASDGLGAALPEQPRSRIRQPLDRDRPKGARH
ncbi:MAG: hypothetical protein M3Y35_14700, partial [Actinomycetota bacterium]|nr:hypothetical protein [Actinomycetota bacterium]